MKTLTTNVLALLCLAQNVPAQQEAPTDYGSALAQAALLEEREGDLAAAERAYRALLAEPAAAAVHDRTAFRLGALLWRLDRSDDAEPLLQRAAAANAQLAAEVAAVRAETGALAQARQDRVERGKALVERFLELSQEDPLAVKQVHLVLDEMLNLRAESAQALVAWLRDHPGQEGIDGEVGARVYKAAIHTLWRLGSQPAVDYLAEVAHGDDLVWQRFVIQRNLILPNDLQPVLRAFARVPDPTRECWHSVRLILASQEPQVSVDFFLDEHPAVAEAGLAALADRWPGTGNSLPWPQRLLDEHADRLLAWATDERPRHHQPAWRLLWAGVRWANLTAARLLATAVRRAPRLAPPSPASMTSRQQNDGSLFALIVQAAAALPPAEQADAQVANARDTLARLLECFEPAWDRESAQGVIPLLDLGYGRITITHGWIAHSYSLGDAALRASVLRRLPEIATPTNMLQEIEKSGAAPELFLPIRDIVDQCADSGARINWAPEPRSTVAGNTQTLDRLFLLAARTGHPDAAAWLSSQIDIWPHNLYQLAYSLVLLSRANAGEPAARGLRQLLTVAEPQMLASGMRRTIFFELTRVGDEAAIGRYSRAFVLGLGGGFLRFNQPETRAGETDGIRARLTEPDGYDISPLAALGASTPQRRTPWHGYDDVQLVLVWRELLTGEAAALIWPALATRLTESLTEGLQLPTCTIPLFAELLPTHAEVTTAASHFVHRHFHTALASLTPATFAEATMRDAVVSLLDIESDAFAASCYQALPQAIAIELAERARQHLRRSGSTAWLTALTYHHIPVGADAWLAALAGTDVHRALRLLPPAAPIELRPAVVARLDDTQDFVRIEACKAMGRAFPDSAAAAVLPMLQDPSEHVRTAAREQLTLLREAQEQRQFWARVQGGVDLTPQATSQKLVQQAMPGQETAQRVLAIRSLAAVGASEALPHLIEWSKDEDAQVRAAATSAIQAILQKSEAGK